MPQDWPSLIIGLLMLAYWARVMRLVIKTKKRVGKAANLVPPEPLGRVLRIVWYPVVAIWIVHPLTYAFSRNPHPIATPIFRLSWLEWLAIALSLAAFAATLVCWKKMGRSWRMGIDPSEKTDLIVQGPYAYVRHPIYALSIALMLCTMLILPSPLMLVAGAIHILFLIWESRREEQYLVQTHGEPYVRYCSQVSRFIPFRSITH